MEVDLLLARGRSWWGTYDLTHVVHLRGLVYVSATQPRVRGHCRSWSLPNRCRSRFRYGHWWNQKSTRFAKSYREPRTMRYTSVAMISHIAHLLLQAHTL
jgi:hypothetical protein